MLRIFQLIVIASILAACVGCETTFGFATSMRQVNLSMTQPRDDELGIDLVRVEPSGTVIIHADNGDQTLAANIGEAFRGRRTFVQYVGMVDTPFGREGLTVMSSDPGNQQVVLSRMSCKPFRMWGPFNLPLSPP